MAGSTEINLRNNRAAMGFFSVSGMLFSEVRCLWDKMHFTLQNTVPRLWKSPV